MPRREQRRHGRFGEAQPEPLRASVVAVSVDLEMGVPQVHVVSHLAV
jgi:hypothetical protein